MTAPELAEAARALVERSTTAQRLPAVIEDESFYRRVATLLDDQRDVSNSGVVAAS